MVGYGTQRILLVAVVFAVSTTTGYSQYQRKAGLGGRPVRGNSGLKWVSIQSTRKQQTMVNQVVNGVVGTKPNSSAKKKEITAIQTRLSVRMPLAIVPPNTNRGRQVPKQSAITIYGLKMKRWYYTNWGWILMNTRLGK